MKDGMWEEMRRNAVILFEGVLLPQADMLMDWVQLSVVRGDFIFFYPFTTLPGTSAWQ